MTYAFRLLFGVAFFTLTVMPASVSAELPPEMPADFVAALPRKCKQVLFTVSNSQKANSGRLWLMQRVPHKGWRPVQPSIPVMIGRSGMAWGSGLHDPKTPAGWRRKKEGDGCTPAGVFALPTVFGTTQRLRFIRMPYLRCNSYFMGIDDPKSRYYNQIVDFREVQMDWGDAEIMADHRGHYNLGLVIGHNPKNVPGAGSCIFMHIWLGENTPTSGCTAMSQQNIERAIEWLDPDQHPHVMQAVIKP